MGEFCIPLRVYIEDTDAGGIVYYVNYLKFMERARTEWLRSIGSDFGRFQESGYQYVVHSLDVQYRRPARMDDALTVTVELVRVGKTFLQFQQRVLKSEEVMCEAQVKVACVDTTKLKPAAIPAALAAQFRDRQADAMSVDQKEQ